MQQTLELRGTCGDVVEHWMLLRFTLGPPPAPAGEQPSLTPRKVTILNTATQSFIQDLNFPSSVLAVRMNRKRCVVQLPYL